MSKDRIKLIEEMLATNPSDPFLNYAAALEYKKKGEESRAMEILEELLRKNEDYLGAYYQLGRLYEGKDRVEEAIKTYRAGCGIAKSQNDMKTLGELTEALMLVDDDFDGTW